MNHQPNSDSKADEREFHLDEHLCLDLLLGFLSPEEEERILSHLSTCPPCEKLLQERAAEGARLEATRVLRIKPGNELTLERRGTAVQTNEDDWDKSRLRDFLSRLLNSITGRFLRPHLRLAGGLAAAMVVLLLVVWIYHARTPEAPPLHLLPPYSFQLQTRETPGIVEDEDLRAGLEAYNNEDFKRAVDLLEHAKELDTDEIHEMIRRIYLGSALAWRGKYKKAAEVLEGVSFPLVPGQWSGEAHWTLFVALKKSGRETSADSLLQIIATKEGEVGERARTLLKQQKWE